jgi:GntR family transcriptional repressor for pyruvate dehydrogenase complex
MRKPKPAELPRRRTPSLAQQVMDDLTLKIRNGVYQPGEKMPTEPEVMAEQGVSRTVVREAMSRLQAAGLVETRHGVGTFVLTPPVTVPPLLDFSTVASIKEVLAMIELRVSLETEAAGLAALRRTDEHLALMRAALDEFEREVSQGRKAVEADFQFHLQIALATGNQYFEEFYRHLGTATIPRTRLDTSQLSAHTGPNYLHKTNQEHQRILDAITRQDAQAARDHMHKHLADSQERLRRAYEAQGRL